MQNLRSASVVAVHHDGAHARKIFVKLKEVADVGTTPGVNCLVGVSHYKKIIVVRAQGFHHFVLNHVYVLKLVYHYVFKALLPLKTDGLVGLEDIKHKLKEVVVVKAKAFFLLVEVSVKNDVVGFGCSKILLVNLVQTHADKVFVVVRLFKKFFYFYHVARIAKGHLTQGESAFFVNNLQHCIDVGIVQNKKAFWIGNSVGIFLQHAYTKTMKRRNITGVVVTCKLTDSAAHFGSSFVGKGNAKNM